MLQRITCALLAATTCVLTAIPAWGHDHCDDPANPLCTPKGVVAKEDRGSGRVG